MEIMIGRNGLRFRIKEWIKEIKIEVAVIRGLFFVRFLMEKVNFNLWWCGYINVVGGFLRCDTVGYYLIVLDVFLEG